MAFDPSVINGQIENFIQSARKLEADLETERKRSQKIAVEYVDVRGKLETAVKTLQAQLQQRTQRIQQLTSAIEGHRQNETALSQRATEISEVERKTREELGQYKSAWSKVLAREAETRKSLAENQSNRQVIFEQKQALQSLQQELAQARLRSDGFHRAAESFQAELQATHGKLKATEARLLQYHQEYQKVVTNNRALTEEISRLKSEIERTAQAEKERLQDLARRSTNEQLRQAELERENGELKERIRALHATTHAETERLRLRMNQLNQTLEAANQRHDEEAELQARQLSHANERAERAEIVNGRNHEAIQEMRARIEEQDKSLNLLRLEKMQLQTLHESTRKTLSKEMLVERLRYEAEIDRLEAMLENLERARIRIVALESDVEIDGPILTAYPLDEARSSPNTETHVRSRAPEV